MFGLDRRNERSMCGLTDTRRAILSFTLIFGGPLAQLFSFAGDGGYGLQSRRVGTDSINVGSVCFLLFVSFFLFIGALSYHEHCFFGKSLWTAAVLASNR